MLHCYANYVILPIYHDTTITLTIIFIRYGCIQVCPSKIGSIFSFCKEGKVASYKTSSMCTIPLLFHFMSESCWRKRFRTCGNQGKIVFVRVSGRIPLHYQYLFALVQIVPSWHVIIHTHAQHRLTCVHRSTLVNYVHFYSPSPAAFLLWLLV